MHIFQITPQKNQDAYIPRQLQRRVFYKIFFFHTIINSIISVTTYAYVIQIRKLHFQSMCEYSLLRTHALYQWFSSCGSRTARIYRALSDNSHLRHQLGIKYHLLYKQQLRFYCITTAHRLLQSLTNCELFFAVDAARMLRHRQGSP